MSIRPTALLSIFAAGVIAAGSVHAAALLPPFKPSDPEQARAYRDHLKELRTLNGRYFRTNYAPKWDEGIAILRERNDPVAARAMLEVFESARPEVRHAVYEHCASIGHPYTDALIAYEAVFGRRAEDRALCADLVVERAAGEGHELAHTPKAVLAAALRSEDESAIESAAVLIDRLNLAEAIPALITAQVAQPQRSGERSGPLGTFVSGRQTAYVSDLQPVVADGAVAFDPTISVITEGAVLQVDQAAVTIYRTVVHDALVSLSSRLTGQPTGHLGYDQWRWKDWYETEFLAGPVGEEEEEEE